MTNLRQERAAIVAFLTGIPVPSLAADDGPERRLVEIETPLANPQPLQGYLRQPRAPGRRPPSSCFTAAMVVGGSSMNVGASGSLPGVTSRWPWTASVRAALQAPAPPARRLRPLTTPIGRWNSWCELPSVDPDRVAVIGFSQGGWLALNSVERGFDRAKLEGQVPRGHRLLSAVSWLQGQHDRSDADPGRRTRRLDPGQGVPQSGGGPRRLRNLAPEGRGRADRARWSLPAPTTTSTFRSSRRRRKLLGHHLEFNQAARDQSIDALRKFLYATIGRKENSP